MKVLIHPVKPKDVLQQRHINRIKKFDDINVIEEKPVLKNTWSPPTYKRSCRAKSENDA